jgi:hypothetical protein
MRARALRVVGACLCGMAAFALWMWATGPGTSLLLAIPGYVIGFLGARLFWGLTRPPGDLAAEDTAPAREPPR